MTSYGAVPDDERCDATVLAAVVGGRDASGLAAALLARWGTIAALARLDPVALEREVGASVARRLHAALVLGRRSLRPPPGFDEAVDQPQKAVDLLWPRMVGRSQEELYGLYLDRHHRVLGLRMLSRGSESFTIVDTRQIMSIALALGANNIVLGHNHPSGDPRPSPQDHDVTRRVASAAQVLGVRLVDHLVISDTAWTSIAAEGTLPPWRPPEAIFVR